MIKHKRLFRLFLLFAVIIAMSFFYYYLDKYHNTLKIDKVNTIILETDNDNISDLSNVNYTNKLSYSNNTQITNRSILNDNKLVKENNFEISEYEKDNYYLELSYLYHASSYENVYLSKDSLIYSSKEKEENIDNIIFNNSNYNIGLFTYYDIYFVKTNKNTYQLDLIKDVYIKKQEVIKNTIIFYLSNDDIKTIEIDNDEILEDVSIIKTQLKEICVINNTFENDLYLFTINNQEILINVKIWLSGIKQKNLNNLFKLNFIANCKLYPINDYLKLKDIVITNNYLMYDDKIIEIKDYEVLYSFDDLDYSLYNLRELVNIEYEYIYLKTKETSKYLSSKPYKIKLE